MPIPQAAVAAQLAGADDYRLTTPPEEWTPAGLIDRINEYLISSGYAIRPDLDEAA